MKDSDKSKDHIRAARDWLGDAENSLDQDDEIRGDLKVMLAKAELSQVGEGKKTRRMRRWAGRLAPFAAAVCIAAAGLYGWQAVTRTQNPPSAVTETESAEAPDALQQPPSAAVMPPGEENADATHTAPLPDSGGSAQTLPAEPAQPAMAAAPVAAPAETDRQEAVQVPRQAAPQPQAPRVPDAETQKLMQTAGQALRAQ